MVNMVTVAWSLISWTMKKAGFVEPCTVEIEVGTVMRFWIPSQTISKSTKPAIVLLHAFCADGLANWMFQIISLSKNYAVYVPDFIFFGGSTTDKLDRSPSFQAECLAKGLKKLGVEKCAVVGLSYGGMVALKMAELYSELVQAVVISGSVLAIEECMVSRAVEDIGFSSCSEMLLPSSTDGLRTLLSVTVYRNIHFPNCMLSDFLQVMFSNRNERSELLEALVNSYKDIHIPKFSQRIHLLWGEKDKIFKPEIAHKIKERLGNNTTVEVIKKAGHLVNLERPCVYNKCLNKFLSSVMIDEKK
ncbi:uncharacterized protein LOC127120242 [Lathyrus oleraceus]|uniref:AB hydrolase-1 domain-containing protein n=2 Tax=Pisum sativum TaxID=3888 RepID=A0A9D4YM09_PEA|nr:uncharacterized protein LOC127120242 [Pisum sativum]KAI5438946.1 hypothetical protein KIW84_024612 [Pisum sativum]